ncbi:hypothetical protein Rs2_00234 [Raphanus sativus]|nr:hypothetical protein Rs2_00234 [Raphanus sativus]
MHSDSGRRSGLFQPPPFRYRIIVWWMTGFDSGAVPYPLVVVAGFVPGSEGFPSFASPVVFVSPKVVITGPMAAKSPAVWKSYRSRRFKDQRVEFVLAEEWFVMW